MSDALTFAIARRARGACSSSTTIPLHADDFLDEPPRDGPARAGRSSAATRRSIEMGMEGGELEIGATAAPAGFATTA